MSNNKVKSVFVRIVSLPSISVVVFVSWMVSPFTSFILTMMDTKTSVHARSSGHSIVSFFVHRITTLWINK
ncbi:MAG: hypothetical protein IPN86_12450 [Saprospiraceae bacterium]|nr:hypothetical protein [Saprospiraceae bacterium]